MKLFFKYLKQRLGILVVFALFCVIFAFGFRLYHLPAEAVAYPAILCLSIGLIVSIFDFSRVKRKHELLKQIRSITDTASDILPKIDNIQDEDYQQIIRLIREEHNQYRDKTDLKYADMVNYYTVWAHQIKTPITSMRLHLQNEDTCLSRTLASDLSRIEQYAEMVLTFLRLDSESTDYVFKEYDLDTIVRSAVKKFSSEFIFRKLSLNYQPLNTTVVTDEKWLSFVIEQVLSNALKYTPSGSITITLENEKTLRIKDTGTGIAPEDLPRIFENGYTGYNGRVNKKASGIGLYLCRRICSNLGHTISAQSILDSGTIIDIDLAQTKLEIE